MSVVASPEYMQGVGVWGGEKEMSAIHLHDEMQTGVRELLDILRLYDHMDKRKTQQFCTQWE